MPRSSKLADALIDSNEGAVPANAGTTVRQMRPGRRKTALTEVAADKPVALTVKVDQPRYEALKVLGARTRRSTQEILLAALDAYLRVPANDGPSNVRPSGGQPE